MKDKNIKAANGIIPTLIFHPGIVLGEEIDFRGITRRKAAADMGISPTVLSEIISGKRNITAATAIRIENALGINALFFLNMQVRFDYYTLKKKLGQTAA